MAKEKMGKQPAGNLQKIITEDRERKKTQDTADKIFGKRAGGGKKADAAVGSTLNRAGVYKKAGQFKPSLKPNSLAARATGRGAVPTPTGPRADARAKLNAQGLADALFSAKPNPAQSKFNITPNKITHGNGRGRDGGSQFAGAAARAGARQQAPTSGALTIKGLAGPHVVEVRGFAPGTTAADIEEALRNKGISVHSCRILQSSPTVIVDILCETKEDADRIGQFHMEWTDYDTRTGKGFQLFVFAPRPAATAPVPSLKPQPARNNGVIVDGSMGFEPLPVDYGNSDSGLYSDQLMQASHTSTQQTSSHSGNNHQTSNRRGRGSRGGRASNNR